MDKLLHKIVKKPIVRILPCLSGRFATAEGHQGIQRSRRHSLQRSNEVLANRNGLYINWIQPEKIEPEQGYFVSAFAPLVYLEDAWQN